VSRMTTLQKKSRSTARRANKRAAKTVSPAAADARDAAVRYADATRDWAAPKVETAVDWAAPKVETAVDWAAPKVNTARDWAGPRVEPAVEKVKSDVLPAVAGAVISALAATEPARSEAATRGSAALAALKGEVDPPRRSKHRIRKLFVLTAVLGGAYAGWKAWVARNTDPVDAWTTAPAPSARPQTPVGSVTPVSAGVPTDDPAGASPDEALADAAAEEEAAEEEAPVDLTTTEPVSAASAKKVSQAAAKGAKPTGKGSTTS
jgi:hypothetical protein